MNRHINQQILTIGIFSLIHSATAWAGVLITSELDLMDGQKAKRITTQIDGRRMVIDGNATAAQASSIIFFGPEQKMIIVAHFNKTYATIDEKMVAQISGAMTAARAQMEEVLKTLPPEQRKMAEQHMPAQMGGKPGANPAKVPQLMFKKLGETAVIAGRKCQRVEGYAGTELVTKACVMSGDELFKQVLPVTKDMMRFTERMQTWGGSAAQNHTTAINSLYQWFEEMGGMPVATENYEKGKKTSEWRLIDVRKINVPASAFQPPKGYQEQKMPALQ